MRELAQLVILKTPRQSGLDKRSHHLFSRAEPACESEQGNNNYQTACGGHLAYRHPVLWLFVSHCSIIKPYCSLRHICFAVRLSDISQIGNYIWF